MGVNKHRMSCYAEEFNGPKIPPRSLGFILNRLEALGGLGARVHQELIKSIKSTWGAGQESCWDPSEKEWWQRWKNGAERPWGDGAIGFADESDLWGEGRMEEAGDAGFVGMSSEADGETINQGQG